MTNCGAADRIRTGVCSIDNRELSPVELQPRIWSRLGSHHTHASDQRAAARCSGGCGRIRTSNAPKSSGFTARQGNQLPQHTHVSGGDDPIQTDGALQKHSALAVRRLRPLGHVSLKSLVGMERFELSRAKALVSKTSVSPISTTSPSLTNSRQPSYTSSVQVLSTKPIDTNGGLPGTRTLKMTQLLRLPRLPIPPEAHKAKAP